MADLLVEVCVEGVDGAIAAERGGAGRVELCASLLEGGITPSLGAIRETLARVRVPVRVMVRPRGGDFLYSDAEFASMLADVAAVRAAGGEGVVAGCLLPDGRIDAVRMRALVEAAGGLRVTCHRAFDMTEDPDAALDTLIGCGVDCVLTSGQCADAVDAIPLLRRLAQRAGGRITVLGCGALRPETIGRVRREAGLSAVHFAAPATAESGMRFRREALAMGGVEAAREYRNTLTDPDLVRATIAAARA